MYSSHYGKLKMPFNHFSHPKRDEQSSKEQDRRKNSRNKQRSFKDKTKMKGKGDDGNFYVHV